MKKFLHIALAAVLLAAHPPAGDGTLFRQSFHHLQAAVAKHDSLAVESLLYFPLLTSPQWTNDDIKDKTADTTGGEIDQRTFDHYYRQIFHADVCRLLPKAGEANLNVIDRNTKENYYRRLMRRTDPGSALYEVYMQYPEGFFAFVFGRIAGRYKVVSYYAKWPVTN